MMEIPILVKEAFDKQPIELQPQLLYLRQLIMEVVGELGLTNQLEETLKWGEPSYIAPKGSTIRLNRRKKAPHQYAIYFKCTSKLVPHFREMYGDIFEFENNRAIVFDRETPIPVEELKDCIQKALTYHQIKQEL
jgi:hypothetical protein